MFEVKKAGLQMGKGKTTKRMIPQDGPAQPPYYCLLATYFEDSCGEMMRVCGGKSFRIMCRDDETAR